MGNDDTMANIRLGKVELEIMKVVWERETATVHDVTNALGDGRKPAYSTILTMMRKLEGKGFLTHETVDRTYVYRAVRSRKSVSRHLMRDLLDRLFGGSAQQLVNCMIDRPVSQEECDAIARLLEHGDADNVNNVD